jgi:hypothetical protein
VGSGFRSDETIWTLKTPIPQNWRDRPHVMWELTDDVAQAVEVVLRAVSTELSKTAPSGGQP